jgi:hypothetical protein
MEEKMGNIFYVLRMILITVVLVVLMQVEVGHKTIENHAEGFIRQSGIMAPARSVAQGGFVFFKVAYHKGSQILDSFFTKNFRNENSPGRRKLVELKRSFRFEKENEKREELKRQKAEARNDRGQEDQTREDDGEGYLE